MNVMRPALRYYGAKWLLAPVILELIGSHEVYVEPYGGSAAVLLRKRERSLLEVYNDLDVEVVNFFFVLREMADEFISLVDSTPFSLDEFTRAQNYTSPPAYHTSSSSVSCVSSSASCSSSSVSCSSSLSDISLSFSLSLLRELVESGEDLKSVRLKGSHTGRRKRKNSYRSPAVTVVPQKTRLKGSHASKHIRRCLEAARLFYIRSYLGISGPTSTWNTGFRRQKIFSRGRNGQKMMSPAAQTFTKTDHILPLRDRLRGVTIDNLDAIECIEKYDSPQTLFYVDPPYPADVRERKSGYRHEMSLDDHRRLLQVLNKVRGQVILSSYESLLYATGLEGWARKEKEMRINGSGSAVEVIWMNEAAAAARPQMRLL